jgi:hypothetical protein
VKLCDADTVITPARIGPAHGAYTNPSPPPTSIPDQNPARDPAAEPARGRGTIRVSHASSRSPNWGTSRHTPNASSTAIASVRSSPSGRPSAEITYTSATVANVNESARPVATPSGRRRPPVTPAENTTGRAGSTQGERAVAAPATSAKAISTTKCSGSYGDRHR